MACSLDYSFGAVLPSSSETGCRDFDFRVIFEDAFFVLMPSLVILPLVAGRITSIFRCPKIVIETRIRNSKLATYAVLGALQLATLALFASRDASISSRVTLPAYAFQLISTIGILILSALDHTSTPGPSVLLQIYLLLTLFFDAALVRTRWLLAGERTMASLQSAALVVKLVLLLLESLSKDKYITVSPRMADISPEEKAGFFSKSLLLWLNPLFIKGYRDKLSEPDFFPLGIDLSASNLTEQLNTAWEKTEKSSEEYRLALALTRAFWKQLLLLNLPRLALVGFSIAQPVLVQVTLVYVTRRSTAESSIKIGCGLIGAFALNYLGVAVSTVWFQHQTFRLMVMIRGSLIGMIFRHSLRLPASESDGGDRSSNGGSDAVSLASTEIERIVQTLQWSLNIIPNMIQVGIGLWILETHLGGVCVAPVIVAMVCGVIAALVGKQFPPRQRRWMQAIQKRIRVTSKDIGAMKSIKMSGLAGIVARQIQEMRESEINDQKAFRRVQISKIALGNAPAMLTAAVTFTAFSIAQLVQSSDQFDVIRAYASLSLLSILINPVAELVSATTNLASSLSSLDHIQEFLNKAGQKDSRTFTALLPDSSDTSDSGDSTGLELQHVGNQSLQVVSATAKDSSTAPPSSAVIRIVDGTFGWSLDKAVLNGINFCISTSTFTIITGPTASGKTALLRSILGETYTLSGAVECASPKQIAYCNHEPWILNISLCENILGVSDFDEERYQTVIEACQLADDFAQLPDGDQTLAGNKGMSLSGGQKQRISLARAAYSGKTLIVMDDTLQGLDATTSYKCFQALLGPSGLFRQAGRTVVFATHNVHWFPFADEILVLGDEGRITGCGSFQTLKETNDYVRQLHDDNPKLQGLRNGETALAISDSTSSNTGSEARKEAKKRASESSSEDDTLGSQDSTRARPKKVGAFRYYIQSLGSKAMIGFALLVCCLVGCNTAQPLWLKYWVQYNENHPRENVGKWAGVYMVFAIGAVFFIAVETAYLLLILVPRSAKNLHQRLLYTTFNAPLSFIAAHNTGTIVNYLAGDLNLTDMALPLSFILGSERLVSSVADIILTCIVSGYLAITIPALAVMLYFLQRVYLKTSRQLRRLELELKAPLFSNILDTFSGLITIRAFSWTSAVEQEHMKLLDRSQRPYYLLFCLQRWLTLVLDLTTAALATLLMGLAVALRNTIDPGFLGVALVSVMGLGGTLSALIVNWTNFETSLGAITRIRNYVNTTPGESGGGSDKTDSSDNGTKETDENWPSKGAIAFHGISASYDSTKGNEKTRVLDNIDLTISAGSKVAICGRTGSGKSTLLAVLLRLLEPDAGTITIDGVDLSTVSIDRLRTSVVTLPQDPFFFSGCTVRINLDVFARYGSGDENDMKLWRALEKTGLREWVAERGGLDEELKPESLSTGQRQLFCMARAMLQPGRILLLDEATSHLDLKTEKAINRLIQTEFTDWTVLVVTHHVASVAERDAGFDDVIVMQNGLVVEHGSPASLLQYVNGAFRELEMHESKGKQIHKP